MKKFFDSFLLGLVFVFVLVPFVYFLVTSLLSFNFSSLSGAFFSILLRSWVFGFLQAMLSAATVCALASLFAVSFLDLAPKNQQLVSRGSSLLGKIYFVLPGTVLSLALLSLPFQLSESLSGWPLIILAHSLWSLFFMTSILHRKLNAWLNASGKELLQSAHTLGASRWQSTREVLWPYLKTELREVFVLVFVWSFGAFSTVFLLGDGPQHSTVEVLLFYTLFNDLDSTRLLLVLLLNLATQVWVLKKFYLKTRPLESAAQELQISKSTSIATGINKALFPAVLIFFVLVAMLLIKHFWVFTSSNLLGNSSLQSSLAPATWSSLSYGLYSAAFAFFISLLVSGASTQIRKSMILLFAVSPMVLASLWSQIRMEHLPQLDSNLLLASFALAFTQIPILCLWIDSALSSLDPSSESYLDSLGLSSFQKLWRFRLPYLGSVLLQIQILVFSVAIGDLVMSSVFAPQLPLLSQLARRLAQSYNFEASSWVLMLSLACIGVWMLLLEFVKRLMRRVEQR